MNDLGAEVLKRYGATAVLCAFAVGCAIWGLAHFVAAPGSEVSVLWGLVTYTKKANLEAQNQRTSQGAGAPQSSESPLSPAEVEHTLDKWMREAGFRVGQPPTKDDVYFLFSVENANKRNVLVMIAKSQESLIRMEVPGVFKKHDAELIEKLTHEERAEVERRVMASLVPLDVDFEIQWSPPKITLRKVMFVEEMTRDRFISDMARLDGGVMLTAGILKSYLENRPKKIS
jgi:hypothetical protein